MAICPVANSVGCEKCKVVKVCVLRSVLGNYGTEKPDQNFSEAETIDVENKPPEK
jgi:hypothetical protein